MMVAAGILLGFALCALGAVLSAVLYVMAVGFGPGGPLVRRHQADGRPDAES